MNHIYLNPEKYSINNRLQYDFALQALHRIHFKQNSRLLDIGCGDGSITYEIAKKANDGCIIGTDISSLMIEHANKRYHAQSNLRYIQMNAENNFFREQFDIVTSFNCLHWVQQQNDALLGIAKSAVNGGQVLLLLSHKKSLYHFVIDKLCSTLKWANYFKDYSNPRLFFEPQTYVEMVVKSGLTIVEKIEKEMSHSFNTVEQLKDFFLAAGSQIKQIPEQLKTLFLDDFVEEFLKQIDWKKNNAIPVSFWCLQIVASK